MKIGQKLNQQSSALWNRRLTLQLLRKHGRLSRRQLADMTGLRGSTLTYIVRDLTEQGIVRQAGKRESETVGQKQILIEINADAGWTLGVDLRKEEALLLIQNALGNTLDSFLTPVPADLHAIPETLRRTMTQRLHEPGRPPGAFLGMGVGVPGVVDSVRGMVVISRDFDCADEPLRTRLEELFETSVLIDNNANLAALAEARAGAAVDLSDFIFFLIHHNRTGDQVLFNKAYGCAIYLDGKLHRGFHYAAGEIDDSLQPSRDAVAIPRSDFEALTQAEGLLSADVRRLAEGLGYTIAHLINLIDPQAVIIGANFPFQNRELLDVIRKSADAEIIPIHHRHVRIMRQGLGGMAIALGASTAAVENALFDRVVSEILS